MTAKDLKNALLQKPCRGEELVPQIASEGNASDLLEEIRKEKLSHGFANSYGICGAKGKKSKSSGTVLDVFKKTVRGPCAILR